MATPRPHPGLTALPPVSGAEVRHVTQGVDIPLMLSPKIRFGLTEELHFAPMSGALNAGLGKTKESRPIAQSHTQSQLTMYLRCKILVAMRAVPQLRTSREAQVQHADVSLPVGASICNKFCCLSPLKEHGTRIKKTSCILSAEHPVLCRRAY